MDAINVKGTKINLNFEPQQGSKGRPFRLSGIKIDYSKPPKWIDKQHFHCTWYIFKYLDNDEFFAFYFDEYDNYQYKLINKEVLELN